VFKGKLISQGLWVVLSGLAGCGGGGAGSAPAPADPRLDQLGVVGSWDSDCHFATDEQVYKVVSLSLANNGTLSLGAQSYQDANCQVNEGAPLNKNGTYKIGNRLTNTDAPTSIPVYELDFVIDGATQLDIVGISGDTLYFGVEEDKVGRILQLDTQLPYTKQGSTNNPPVPVQVTNPDNGNDPDNGSDPTNGPVSGNPAPGIWLSQCLVDEGGNFFKAQLSFTPAGLLNGNFLIYEDGSCQLTSTVATGGTFSGSYQVGQAITVASGHSAYEIDMTVNGEHYLEIFGIVGNRGYFGVETGTGSRPTELDFETVYEKQSQ
jgi:hypothetical protein